MLAMFCYHRSHLHALAFVNRFKLTERDLGPTWGCVELDAVRAVTQRTGQPHAPSQHSQRKPITLSTKPLNTFVPLDDLPDDEEAALYA